MIHINLNISFNPTLKHISEIEEWLQDEDNFSKEGFYCQWDIIKASFLKKRMIVITQNEITVGFLIYSINDFVAEIIIAEIRPNNRNQGIGKELIEKSCNYFIKKGVLVVELFCSPVKSETVWKKMGFINFPDGVIQDSRIYLYKILVPTLDFCQDDNSIEIIEIWNKPDHMAYKMPPEWRWEIKRDQFTDKLINPIIHPSFYEWPVCWRYGNNINEKRIMKNFNKRRNEHGHFLIINELQRID